MKNEVKPQPNGDFVVQPLVEGGEAVSVPKGEHGLKDSGTKHEFATGGKRDLGPGNRNRFRRYDLLPVHALHFLAMHYGRGAAKYADRNWEKGIPLSNYVNSAEAHMLKLKAGYTDEDHAIAWLWNVACYVETKHRIDIGLLPKELDDMPTTFAGFDPPF